MGTTHTQEFANAVARDELQLRTAVMYQLRYNFYPPLPSAMIDPCVRAIKKARNGDMHGFVTMPKGMQYNGKSPRRNLAPVWAVIDAHRLGEFVDLYDEDCYDYEEEECED